MSAELIEFDIACQDCGLPNDIVWMTDNVFWNHVIGGPDAMDDAGGYLCVRCFVQRAEAEYDVKCWRLVPEFAWAARGGAAANG